MNKTSQKVIKDPKKVEQGKKSYETSMKRLKEQILEEHQPPTSSSACDPTLSTSSSTCDSTPSTSSSTRDPIPSTSSFTCGPTPSTSSHATRSNDTYIYGIGMFTVLAIGACVFFAYNTFPKNKKPVNEKQDHPPKRCHML